MSILAVPDQTIPESQKTEEWHINHVANYVAFSLSENKSDQRADMLKYYRAYFAELTEKELKMIKKVTHPNGRDLGVEYIVYPLIQTKIEQIVGEYMSRPTKRKAYAIDKKSKNSKFEEKLKILSEEIMREITEDLQPDLGFTPETESPEVDLPDDVEEFFEKDFKMIAEELADNLVSFFLEGRREKSKLREMFLDYCVTDRTHAVIDKSRGHTTARKVHPLDCDYDIDPYKTVQDDHEYFFENYWLTENEVYNTFDLNAHQKVQVKSMFESMNRHEGNYDSDELAVSRNAEGWFDTSNKVHRIRMVNAMWKSRKKVSIKESQNNKTGETIYKKLGDKDKPRKKDKVKEIVGEMPRYVQMLGPDICLGWGLMEQRFSYIDNQYLCSLPVVSIIRDNTTGSSKIKSVAAKLFQLQEVASEILYEIRLAIKHMGDSRVLVYDAAQTPKEFSKGGYENGLNRVMHHVKKDKFMIINSKEKGFKGNFNQFTSLDLSQKGSIQDMFNGLAVIEDLASKFVGISPEREGAVGQYQTASGTERAIQGSHARTEVIFTPFDEFVQVLLEKVLMKMKHDYADSEVIQYVIGDMKTKFIKMMGQFFEADFGIYLSDAGKDKEAAERIDRAAEMAMSTANTPDLIMGLIEVFEGESASEKKAVFQRMLNSMEEARQQQMQAEQEAQQAAAEQEEAAREQDMLKARETNEKDINVAKIYANNKSATEAMKHDSEERQKAAELAEQSRREMEQRESGANQQQQ